MIQKLLTVLVALVALTVAAAPAPADSDAGWTDLFNGKDLTGWSNPYDWGKAWVEDGVICLQADKKFFLVTEKTYGDFELECQIMLPAEGKANSGVMYRCNVQKNKVFGYQAECDPTPRAWTGGLYDEGRRGWLQPTNKERGKTKLVQAPMGEWVSYRIKCVGDHLQVWIDGKQTTDYHDDKDASGHIGIQHHGEKGQIYKFRNIRIREVAAQAKADPAGEGWITLFDGKSFDGWEKHGGKANYKIEDGAIVGTSVPNTSNTFMCTKQTFTDFELVFDVKVHDKLNSGVQLRSRIKDNDRVYGPQCEIESSPGESGFIYGEGMGTGWISKPRKHEAFKNGQWNTYRIIAEGNNIKTWINGEPVEDLTDDRTLAEGFIGLQVHGVGKRKDPMFAMWRNIKIRPIKKD